MTRIELRPEEVRAMQDLVGEIAGRFDTVEDPQFLREATLYAHELPRRVRHELNQFKLTEPIDAHCLITGWPVDNERIGPTPAHWNQRNGRSQVLEEEILLMLCGSLLGDPIGWATQQKGYLMHDILPIKGNEHEQLGSGSEELLWWHVEDAFHDYRGDYLGMFCLRNPDAVATTFASFDGIELEPHHLDLLFQPHYTIRPDESHLVKNRAEPGDPDDELAHAYERIDELNQGLRRIPVLYGDRRSPYLRLDPYFMDPVEDPPEAQEALDALVRAIDARLADMVLHQGELIFVDNFKAVHGRKPFKARYDGQDRWLKRINIARDLRKSREARRESDGRVIY